MDVARNYGRTKERWFDPGIIITIYIALKPLYFKASGTLQLGDMFMVFGMAYLFFSLKGRFVIPLQTVNFLRPLFLFVIFISVVNGIWSITGYNHSKYSLYYIFNFIAVIMCILVFHETGVDRFKQSVLNGALISSIITTIGLQLSAGNGRGKGFFNNPNQLGYYGVVLIAFALLCKKDRLKIKEIVIIVLGFNCVVSSLSKAAFVSLIIQSILYVFLSNHDKSLKNNAKQIAIIIILGVLLYLFFFSDFEGVPALETLTRMRTRLFGMVNEKDTNLGSGRGYDRIKELGIHLLWGMGEGNFKRFIVMRGAEVHSTYASIIVSYGLVGMFLYSWFLCKAIIVRRYFLENVGIMSGVLLYSISHNGVRNTLVWILITAVYISCQTDDNKQREKTVLFEERKSKWSIQ